MKHELKTVSSPNQIGDPARLETAMGSECLCVRFGSEIGAGAAIAMVQTIMVDS